MKPFIDLVRLPGWRPKTISLSLVSAAALAAGCSKSNTPAPAAAPQSAPEPANSVTVSSTPAPVATAAPAQMANPPAMTTTNTGSMTTLQFLNRAMIGWMRQNHRRPASFEEFVSTAGIQIPDPPPGKKYALNGRGFIILVDSSTQ